MIREVSQFQTDDGKIFDSIEKAQSHVVDLAGERLGNLLESMGANGVDVRKVLLAVLVKPDSSKAYENVQKLRATLNGIDLP